MGELLDTGIAHYTFTSAYFNGMGEQLTFDPYQVMYLYLSVKYV